MESLIIIDMAVDNFFDTMGKRIRILRDDRKIQLQAAADAIRQRGSRADMLAEVATGGPAMLTTEDTAAANAWLRRRVRVMVRDNQVTEVVFNFW